MTSIYSFTTRESCKNPFYSFTPTLTCTLGILSLTKIMLMMGKRSPTHIVSTSGKGFRDITTWNPSPTWHCEKPKLCFLFFVFHHHHLLLLACYVLFQLHTSIILVVSLWVFFFFFFNFVFQCGFINTFCGALDSSYAMIWKGTVKRKIWNEKEKEKKRGRFQQWWRQRRTMTAAQLSYSPSLLVGFGFIFFLHSILCFEGRINSVDFLRRLRKYLEMYLLPTSVVHTS